MTVPPWIRVPYPHDSANPQTVHLAVSGTQPAVGSDVWTPAYRDVLDGQRVVCIRAAVPRGARVWLRDDSGVRRARPLPA